MPSTNAIRAGKAYVEIATDDTKLARGLHLAQARLRKFGSAVQSAGLKVFAAGSAIVGSLALSVRNFAAAGHELEEMAARTGISAAALSELGLAAKMSGVEMDVLEAGLRKMARTVQAAADGSSASATALPHLGLTAAQLKGLTPDQQFAVLADRVSKITDPTLKAALAMQVFGRNATALFPMIERGAAGISEMRDSVRSMGLSMSEQDIAGAAKLHQTLLLLKEYVASASAAIASALTPALTKLAQDFVRAVQGATVWIRQNPGLVISIAKVGVATSAAGMGLIALGQAAKAASVAFGILSTAVNVASTIIPILFSPTGLIVTGSIAAVAAILWATGAGAKALGWLGEQFRFLKDGALAAWQGIGDALAAGDIGLAAKIAWLTLKLEWTRGVAFLKELWATFKYYTLTVINGAVQGAVAAWEIGTHAIADAWYWLVGVLRSAWGSFTDWFKKTHDAATTWLAKRMLEVYSAYGGMTTGELADAEQGLDQKHQSYVKNIEDERKLDDKAWNERMKRREEEHQRRLAQIGEEFDATQKVLKDQQLADISAAEDEIASAKKEWREALNQAKAERDAMAGREPGAPPGAPKIPDLGSAAELMKKIDVIGTFNAGLAQRLGFGPSLAAERTASASEKTADNTKRILQELKDSGLEFG